MHSEAHLLTALRIDPNFHSMKRRSGFPFEVLGAAALLTLASASLPACSRGETANQEEAPSEGPFRLKYKNNNPFPPAEDSKQEGDDSRATSPFWSPLDKRFESLFQRFQEPGFPSLPSLGSLMGSPDIQKSETPDAIIYELALNGIDPASVKVAIQEGQMSISGSQTRQPSPGGVQFQMHSQFHQSFPIPPGVDPKKLQVSQEKGKIRIRLPRIKN
jgi:HSP20 family molecular chaperone IbpA